MSKMKRAICVAAMFAMGLFLLLPSTASANLLSNPSFESSAGGPGTEADDWPSFNFGTFSTQEAIMPLTGTHSLQMGTAGVTTTGSTGVFQPVLGVIPGESYTLEVWAKAGALPIAAEDPAIGVNIQLEWFPDAGGSSAGGQISEDIVGIIGSLTDQYQKFTLAGVAPAGAGHVRPVLSARRQDQLVFWDDASLTGRVIPEPASLGLALFAGLGLLSGRRRKQR